MRNLISAFVVFALLLTIFSFGACHSDSNKSNQDSDTELVNDTLKKVLTVRDELIVNRDTMRFANPDSISAFEYKHTPEITVGEKNEAGQTEIKVKVGSEGIEHPSTEAHWIDFIALNIDGKEVERIEFDNNGSAPEAVFFVDLSGAKNITVFSGCNLHGIWKSSKSVK